MTPWAEVCQKVWGFTPEEACDNCNGSGVFEQNVDGLEPCHFCLSDAIRRGELDGWADGTEYVGGKPTGRVK